MHGALGSWVESLLVVCLFLCLLSDVSLFYCPTVSLFIMWRCLANDWWRLSVSLCYCFVNESILGFDSDSVIWRSRLPDVVLTYVSYWLSSQLSETHCTLAAAEFTSTWSVFILLSMTGDSALTFCPLSPPVLLMGRPLPPSLKCSPPFTLRLGSLGERISSPSGSRWSRAYFGAFRQKMAGMNTGRMMGCTCMMLTSVEFLSSAA